MKKINSPQQWFIQSAQLAACWSVTMAVTFVTAIALLTMNEWGSYEI